MTQTEYEEKIQSLHNEIARKDIELRQKDMELQIKDSELRMKDEQLRQKDEELRRRDEYIHQEEVQEEVPAPVQETVQFTQEIQAPEPAAPVVSESGAFFGC